MSDSNDVRAAAGPWHAFDALVAELDRVRRQSEAYDRQLLQRNRELAAVTAVAQATSSAQLDLSGTLERALQVVLEVTGLSAGWILLVPDEGGEPILTASAGLPPQIVEKQAGYHSLECECSRVAASRRPLVVHPLHAGCPVGTLDLGDGRPPACHAAVPLLTRSGALGVLNLIGDDPSALENELTLLGAIGRQLGVAVENARLWDELRQRDLLRGQLLEQAMAAQEEERRRIARELHDQTGQALASILVWLRALEAEGADAFQAHPDRLQELKAIVADALDGVRDFALELRPSVLDDLGLVPAVQRYARTCQERHGLAIDVQTVGLDGMRLPPAVETALYRIVQEALTNVVQHAHAHRVSLLLEAHLRAVVAIVEDDGCGFEADRLLRGPVDERRLGLSGMRERARLLGGRLSIESAPGEGTAVFVEVPLEEQQAR